MPKACDHIIISWVYPKGFNSPGRRICKHCKEDLGETDHKNLFRSKFLISKLLEISYMLSKDEKKLIMRTSKMPTKSFDWKICEEITMIHEKYQKYIEEKDLKIF